MQERVIKQTAKLQKSPLSITCHAETEQVNKNKNKHTRKERNLFYYYIHQYESILQQRMKKAPKTSVCFFLFPKKQKKKEEKAKNFGHVRGFFTFSSPSRKENQIKIEKIEKEERKNW